MWMIILGALKGNWVNVLKYGAIAAVVATVWWKADSAWDNYKQAIEDRNVEFTQMLLDRQAAEIERDRAMQAVTSLLQQREVLAQIAQDAFAEQEVLRQEAADRMAVFEDHDLQAIADSDHEEWLGKLATEATNKYFEELQNAFNN
jgi:uncharacterized membrane protein YdbT with pleckstrin-like domain